ncbi:unnamed protein product, partial [Iphiclides podalirius]
MRVSVDGFSREKCGTSPLWWNDELRKVAGYGWMRKAESHALERRLEEDYEITKEQSWRFNELPAYYSAFDIAKSARDAVNLSFRRDKVPSRNKAESKWDPVASAASNSSNYT